MRRGLAKVECLNDKRKLVWKDKKHWADRYYTAAPPCSLSFKAMTNIRYAKIFFGMNLFDFISSFVCSIDKNKRINHFFDLVGDQVFLFIERVQSREPYWQKKKKLNGQIYNKPTFTNCDHRNVRTWSLRVWLDATSEKQNAHSSFWILFQLLFFPTFSLYMTFLPLFRVRMKYIPLFVKP